MAQQNYVAVNTYSSAGQLTYQDVFSNLPGGLTPQLVLPGGVQAYSVTYTVTGAGTLTLQRSCNNPNETINGNTATPFSQGWVDVTTTATGGAFQYLEGAGCPAMIRGSVTGAAASDVITICISCSFVKG